MSIIFVPAWGWVGSSQTIVEDVKGMKFSSPLGDGLVLYILRIINVEILFSSPSGDGLVHADFYIIDPRGLNFRPRVGMGWFAWSRNSS